MSIQLLASSLAVRVPAMAQDSPVNNAYLIEKEIEAEFKLALALATAEDKALLWEALSVLNTGVYISNAQIGLIRRLKERLRMAQ